MLLENKIIYEYSKNAWTPFRLIEMKRVIFTFILENSFSELPHFINGIAGRAVNIAILDKGYQDLYKKRLKWKDEVDKHTSIGENVPADADLYNFYFEEIPLYYIEFQRVIPVDVYTKLLQKIGENI